MDKQAYVDKWKAKYDELEAKMRGLMADARIKSATELDELENKKVSWRLRYEELKAAGEDKWEGAKDALERGWLEIEQKTERLKRKVSPKM